jgi:hypothetical protein
MYATPWYDDQEIPVEIPVRIKVDTRKARFFCSDTHRKAAAGNKNAVRESLGEFRDDDDERPEPAMPGEGQGSLL